MKEKRQKTSLAYAGVLVVALVMLLSTLSHATLTYMSNLGVGNASAVQVKGNYAYVTTWDNGLKIVDISNPFSPTLKATVTSPFSGANALSHLCIQGNYAYALDYGGSSEGGLFIVDISNPLSPSVVGSYQLPSGPTAYTMLAHIYVSGNYAYVGDWGYGLGILDVSDPTNPQPAANGGTDPFWYAPFDPWTYDTPATGVFVTGNYAYVTSWDCLSSEDPGGSGDAGGVWVVDINDPTLNWDVAWPDKFVNAKVTEGLSYDVVIHNGYAYVAEQNDGGAYPSQNGFGGLTIIPMPDATSFGTPVSYRVTGKIQDVTDVKVVLNGAVVTDDSYGLSVVNVTTPTSPTLASGDHVTTLGAPQGVDVKGMHIYVADGSAGLTIYSYSGPLIPVELTSFVASVAEGAVSLNWTTQSETENLGYHVYRSITEEGEYSRISNELIRGAGNSDQAHRYFYIDQDVKAGNTYYYKLADVDFNGNVAFHGPISVSVEAVTPTTYILEQCYPNPFNPETAINFSIKETGKVSLKIYNLQGQLIRSLVDEDKLSGSYSVIWNGTNDQGVRVSSGTYLYTLKVNGFEATKKLVFMK